MAFERSFDAIVGRYVLQFQPAPVAMLRQVAHHLHPGGIVAFHELDWDGVRSFPPSPIYDRCCRWIVQTLRLLGAETRMGIKLHSTFVAAGLPAPSIRLGALVGGGAHSADCLELVSALLETLLPAMGRLGVGTADEIGVETLSEQIRREVISSDSVIIGPLKSWLGLACNDWLMADGREDRFGLGCQPPKIDSSRSRSLRHHHSRQWCRGLSSVFTRCIGGLERAASALLARGR